MRAIIFSLALLLLVPGGVYAGGFQTLEQGTWDMGRAMVGSASAADSAATVFYNPAGMTRIDKPQLVLGLMGMLVESEFDLGAATTFSGGDGGNAAANAVVPAGPFFVYPIDEVWAVGFSFTAPFVGSLDYGRSWAGRYIDRTVDLASYRAGPSVAYQVNDWLSLGGTVALNYTKFELKVAIPGLAPGDGRLKIDDADDWEASFGLGALLEPREGTRLGINYVSEVDNNDMSGRIEVTPPAGGFFPGFSSGVDVSLKLPQALIASLRQEVTDDLVLFLDAGWADFSEFEYINLDISSGTTLEIDTHFKDVVTYGLAAEYQLDPAWTLTGGIAYASSPVKRKNRNASLPFDRQVRYAAGIRHQWREDMTLALSYEYLDLGEAELSNSLGGGTLAGKYEPNRVQFLALTVSKDF